MSVALQRLVGLLGVLYVVVTIAPAFFLPPPPAGGASVADIADYYQRHQNALLLFGWIGLLAFPLGFAFVSGLSLRLRGEGGLSTWLLLVALVSISVTLAVAAVQGILALAVPYVSVSARADELKLLADITQLGFSATFAFEISYFSATGALILLSRALPVWLGCHRRRDRRCWKPGSDRAVGSVGGRRPHDPAGARLRSTLVADCRGFSLNPTASGVTWS